MAAPPVVLASASPGRLGLLRAAGIEPRVMVSGVEEDDVDPGDPEAMVSVLARRKATAVAARVDEGLVIGADSTLVLDGRGLGKPHTAAEATARWDRQRGRSGVLLTGHHLIDVASRRAVAAVERTTVQFADVSDEEVAAYVATGEPLEVAGAFALDGYGAAFVERVEGDPSNVIGLSLPLLRRMVHSLDVRWSDLWR